MAVAGRRVQDPAFTLVGVSELGCLGQAAPHSDHFVGEQTQAVTEVVPFDVLVCDYAMPTLNGADIAQRAVTIRPGIVVLLITGFSAQPDNFSWPVLRKPFRRSELADAIAHLHSGPSGLRLVSGRT